MFAEKDDGAKLLAENEDEIDVFDGNGNTVDPLDENAKAPELVQIGDDNAVAHGKRHRGRTMLAEIHAHGMENRDAIILNNLRQPVGPSKEIVQKFSRFLGTLARDCTCVSLTFLSWKYVPEDNKDKIWNYVKKKFIVPEEGRYWVLATINAIWRLHKSRLKKEHYTMYETMEQRLSNRPDFIPEKQFVELLKYWDSEHAKEISEKNKENRQKQTDMHTMGISSFALLRHHLQQNDPNKRELSKGELYMEPRKRKVGRTYLTENKETLENISLDDGSGKSDPYVEVFTDKEHSGRVRFHGRGVTKSKLKEKNGTSPFILPSLFLDSITQQLEQKVKEQVEQKVDECLEHYITRIQEANLESDLVIPDLPLNEHGEKSSRVDLL